MVRKFEVDLNRYSIQGQNPKLSGLNAASQLAYSLIVCD